MMGKYSSLFPPPQIIPVRIPLGNLEVRKTVRFRLLRSNAARSLRVTRGDHPVSRIPTNCRRRAAEKASYSSAWIGCEVDSKYALSV